MTESIPPELQAKLDAQGERIHELAMAVEKLEHQVKQALLVSDHQTSILIALYNGLHQLSALMLDLNRVTSVADTKSEDPGDALDSAVQQLTAFDANLKDIFDRLGTIDEPET